MRKALSKDAIEKAKKHFIEEAEADRGDGAWEALQPLLRAQAHQEDVALTLIELVDSGYLPRERSLEVLEGIHQAHRTNELLLGLLDFAGTQDGEHRIDSASADLDRDSVIYSHTENFSFLCAGCWRDQGLDHEHGETEKKHVVRGRIASPPDVAPSELLRQVDAAMAKRAPCRIYTPDLCTAAGLPDRAAFERRRFDMLPLKEHGSH